MSAPAIPGVWVKGEVSTTPLGLADVLERVLSRLRLAGWQVQSFRADTGAGGWLDLLPRARVVEVKLHKAARYSPRDAAEALSKATAHEGLSLRLVGEYVGEVTEEVIKPTLKDAGAAVVSGVDAVAGGLGLPPWMWRAGLVAVVGGVAWLYVAPFLPRRKNA